MGRKRLDDNEKKVTVGITIKRKYLDSLRVRKINISKLVEDYIREFLEK